MIGSLVSEEVFEGSEEGGFGSDGRVRIGMGGGAGGIGGRREEEEERESEERDGKEDEEEW